METLPILDISALTSEPNDNGAQTKTKAKTTKLIENSLRDTGFMIVSGHGIPACTISSARDSVADLFALPMEIKKQYTVSSNNYRGYIPLGFFDANQGGFTADQYEGYKLHYEVSANDPIRTKCDLYGPNKWPDELTELPSVISDYWRECDQLSIRLMAVFEQILGIKKGFFASVFNKPLTNMTLLRYPPSDSEGDYGIHPHKDTDVLTIVAPDPGGGLWLRPRNSREWISADAPEDCLVINIGDMLELWSGGYFVSTPHKVVNKNNKARISFPYFSVPQYDTVIRPLREPQEDFQRDEVHVGDISREVWRTNWAGAAPKDTRLDLGTLKD